MVKIITNARAIREIVQEALGSYRPMVVNEKPVDNFPVRVNALMDSEDSSSPLDPNVDDPDFMPMNPNELAAACSKMARRVNPEDVMGFYNKFKKLISSTEEATNDSMPVGNVESVDPVVEESLRTAIKKMLIEAPEWQLDDDEEDEEAQSEKMFAQSFGGKTYQEIGKELGISPQRAEQIASTAMDKMKGKYRPGSTGESPEVNPEMSKLFTAVDDYVEFLRSSGELSDEEVKILKDNPDMIWDLEGFDQFSQEKYGKPVKKYPRDKN